MKHLIFKLASAFTLGLSLTLTLLGLMTYLHAEAALAAGPHHVAPNCAGVPAPCYTSVQAAVDAAAPGDVIMVAAGMYTGVSFRGGVTQVVYISKSVTIRGGYTTTFADPPDSQTNPITLDAQGQGRVLYIMGHITPTIEGVRLTGGRAFGASGSPTSIGGGVYINNASVTFNNNQVYNNLSSYRGGGLYLTGSTSAFNNNLIFSNAVSNSGSSMQGYGGGLYTYQSNITLTNNNVLSNTVSIFHPSYTTGYGGGIYLEASKAVFDSNNISFNTISVTSPVYAEGEGGGLYLRSSPATLYNNHILSNTILAPSYSRGGGAFLYASDGTLNQNDISYNTVGSSGGGVYQVISNNMLNENTFRGNSANGVDGRGGGLLMGAGVLTLTNNLFIANAATLEGGGLHVYSITATSLKGDQFFGNVSSSGGGLYLGAGPFTLEGIIAISNTAEYGGGLNTGGLIVMTNSLIADNQANIAGDALYVRGYANLIHSTIADNSGGDGSGIHLTDTFGFPSSLALTNTIIVSQTVGVTLTAGSTATLNSTLWSSNTTNWGGAGTINANNNYVGTPAFVNPAGGDYHLGPTSAAIDKGINAGVADDIDGDTRPQGAVPDLGADEYVAAPLLTISKSGSLTATAGSPISYILTATNSGSLTATNLFITDAIPAGASYLSGGTKVGNVVNWTVPSLAARGGVTQTTFVVTATKTITNSDYGVRAEGGYSAEGYAAVVTVVSEVPPEKKIFLPAILKK